MLTYIREPSNNIKILYYLFTLYIALIPCEFLRSKDGTITLLIFIVWLLNKDIKKLINNLFNNKLALFFLLFILLLFISLFWSTNIERGLNRLNYFKYYFIIMIPIVTVAHKFNKTILLNSYLFSIFIYCLISLSIYLGLLTVEGSSTHNPKPYLDYIIFSSLLGFAGIIAFIKIFDTPKYTKLFYISLFVFFVFILLINNSRNAQLAFFVSIIFIYLRLHPLSLKSFVNISFVSVIIIYIGIEVNPLFKNRFIQGFNESTSLSYNGSIGMRIAGWMVSFDVLSEKPILGHGFGGHEDKLHEHTKVINPEKYKTIQVFGWYHNMYSEFFTATGLFGLSLFLIFISKFFLLNIEDISMKVLSQTFILFNCIIFIGEPILYLRPNAIFFIVFITFFLSLENNKKII